MPKMRRQFSGTFVAQDLGKGAWRLARANPTPVDVFLRGAESAAAEALRLPDIGELDIEWQADAAVLTITSAERRRIVRARSVIVHEPLEHLYDDLPLAGFDEKARLFWRRVFRLVRIPGGRFLLGILARRGGDRQ
jgi:hypothetical protein